MLPRDRTAREIVADLIAPPPDGRKGFRHVHGCPHIAAPAHPRYDGESMSPEPMDIAMKRAASCSRSPARLPAQIARAASRSPVRGAPSTSGALIEVEAIAVLPPH
jgi:hypothetical protein